MLETIRLQRVVFNKHKPHNDFTLTCKSFNQLLMTMIIYYV